MYEYLPNAIKYTYLLKHGGWSAEEDERICHRLRTSPSPVQLSATLFCARYT